MSDAPLLDYAIQERRRRSMPHARPLTPRAIHHRRRRSGVAVIVAHAVASYAVVASGIVMDVRDGQPPEAAPGLMLWLASPVVAPMGLAGQLSAGASAQSGVWLAGYVLVFAAAFHGLRRAARRRRN